jgi:cytochrome P450
MTDIANPEEELPLFPLVREDPFRPAADYERWREEAPLKKVRTQSGQTAWVVLRHADVRTVLEHPSTSRDPSVPQYPAVRAGSTFTRNDVNIGHMDPPLHGRIRKMLASAFTPKRMLAISDDLQKIVDDTLDDVLSKQAPLNFHTNFSLVVTSTAICKLLGIDYSNHTEFERFAAVTVSSRSTPEDFQKARAGFFALVESLVTQQETEPTDGLLGKLVAAMQRGEITREQVVGNTLQLIVGGHETTAHTISMGLVQLWREPQYLQDISDDPDLVPVMIDEMMRTQSLADGTLGRWVREDVELADGTTIKAGEAVLPLLSSANFDPRHFEDPYSFIPARGDKTHVGLGAGIHSCLGQALARAELDLVFRTLTRRVPTLRAAVPLDEVEFQRDGFVWGVRDLQVEWG